MIANQTMYEQNVYYPDVFKGCLHDCVYCKPSFQRQAKRQKQNCEDCYTFKPHIHIERILNQHPKNDNSRYFTNTPKTKGEQFVFCPKGGDLCYASKEELTLIIDFIRDNEQTAFLIQTKNPQFLREFYKNFPEFPKNLILGITLESNLDVYDTPSKLKKYSEISKAPLPICRAIDFKQIDHKRKFVTIEPILQFNHLEMINWMKAINPEVIYIGYDTKGCKLPEPKLEDTMGLIADLRGEGFTVRLKTIRKAWYESNMLNCEKEGKQ